MIGSTKAMAYGSPRLPMSLSPSCMRRMQLGESWYRLTNVSPTAPQGIHQTRPKHDSQQLTPKPRPTRHRKEPKVNDSETICILGQLSGGVL